MFADIICYDEQYIIKIISMKFPTNLVKKLFLKNKIEQINDVKLKRSQ